MSSITCFASTGLRVKKTTLYKERNEEKRQAHLSEIKDIDPRKIIYIDESGVEDTLYRKYARAPRGVQVLADILGHKTQRISIIAGLLGKKLIAPFIFEGYTDADVFNSWLEHGLLAETPPGYTIIMDRASFHRKPKTRQLIEEAGCSVIYLPSYSPDFNPIEEWWAILKAKIKAIMPEQKQLSNAIESAFKNMNYHKKTNQNN